MCLSTVWSRIPTSDPFGARPQDPTVNEEINAVDEGINNPSELPHSNDETTEKEVELNKGQLLVLETIKSNPGSRVPQISLKCTRKNLEIYN